MHIKPDFVPKQVMLETGLTAILLFVLFSPMSIILMFDDVKGEGAFILEIFAYATLAVPIIGSFGHYYWKKLTYNASDYEFKDDRVEYSESFFNQEEKELTYDRIIEVSHKRNIIQRMFGTGTLILQTHATPNVQGGSGLKVPDVLNSQDKYKQIKSLIDDFKKK